MIGRAKRAKKYIGPDKQTASWYCDIVLLPQPLSEESNDGSLEEISRVDVAALAPIEAPCFPTPLLISDNGVQQPIAMSVVTKVDQTGYNKMIRSLADTIAEKGKPQLFLVKESDIRTRMVLEAFAKHVGIAIACCGGDKLLLNAEMELLDYVCGGDNGSSALSHEGFEATLEDITTQLMSMSDADLRSMPMKCAMFFWPKRMPGTLIRR